MEFNKLIDMINNYGSPKSNEYWGLALSGEVGELNNYIKKEIRDKKDFRIEISKEIADVFNYLVLLSKFYGIDLEKAIIDKLDEIKVNAKINIKDKKYEIIDYSKL